MPPSFVERLRREHARDAATAGSGQWQLQYRLVPHGDRLQLSLRVGRSTPNGRLDDERPYWVQRSHLAQPPPFLERLDTDLLTRLAQADPAWLQASEGAWPAALDATWLLQLSASARVRDPSGRALERGPALACECAWAIDAQGRQSLHWQTPPGITALATVPPCFVDTGAGRIGPMDSPYPDAALAWIARGCLLAPDEIPVFRARWCSQLEDWGLPPPHELPRRESSPAPSAQIRLSSPGDEPDAAGDRLSLQFRYADDAVATIFEAADPAAERRLYDSAHGALVTLARAPAQEAALARRLDAALAPYAPVSAASGEHTLPNARAWQAFMLQTLPEMERSGWQFEIDPSFRHRYIRPHDLRIEADWLERDWLELALHVQVDGAVFPLLPLLIACRQQYTLAYLQALAPDTELALTLDDGRHLLLPAQRLAHWLSVLTELQDLQPGTERLRLPVTQRHRLAQLDDGADTVEADEALLAAAHAERREARLDRFEPPAGFHAELRGYQRLGVAWLQQRHRLGTGGILADDMGLGKTLQVLAHIAAEHEHGRLEGPALVVAPTSLLGNWQAEAERFCPKLKTRVLHGPGRHCHWAHLDQYALVITSYALIGRDIERWRAQALGVVVLDEAQAIRNPRSAISRHVRALNAPVRFCLTGTPLQNHLGELWSLLDFLQPGALDSERRFRQRYRRPIEEEGDGARAQALMERIAPFLLRRTKADVAPDLPAKSEITLRIELTDAQRDLYEMLREQGLARLRASQDEDAAGADPVQVLNTLLQLRQVCCDPALIDTERAEGVDSAKRGHLHTMLAELVDEGRSVLVFSQFTRMLGRNAEDLQAAGIEHALLTGATGDRTRAVERFQSGEVPIFLISLKAGGTGLNLTRADTVIHYDPWWNSAAEDQATDRAHRIGQTQPVFVYRLLAQDTVEEKVHALQHRKRELIDQVCTAAADHSAQLGRDSAALMELLED